MPGVWRMTCFEYRIIQDMEIREVQPNGYVKRVSSVNGDLIYYYYNKEGQFIKEQLDFRHPRMESDNDGIVTVDFAERPKVFDSATLIWYQAEILKLRAKNIEYIDAIIKQTETIHKLQGK